MQPPDSFDPPIGQAIDVGQQVRRIVAPNPSPMTYRGTNTYLIGTKKIAVIDPGPNDPAHLNAIERALQPGQSVSHIIVTHTHLDHSPLAKPLAQATGAAVYAYGDAEAGRSAVMQELATGGLIGGGEGVDTNFSPTHLLQDGDHIEGDGWGLDVLHTPGHIGNHICLAWQDTCFTADHVMGWASSLVSPPDGDLTDFLASCGRLAQSELMRFLPGHGDEIASPNARLHWLIAHRKSREAQIIAALSDGALTAQALTSRIYHDIPGKMHPVAARNVLAHLIDLMGKSLVEPEGPLSATVAFRWLGKPTE